MRLFGIIHPASDLFQGNSSSRDDGPVLLLGGDDLGKMLVAQMVDGAWKITAVVNMYPFTLYLYSPEIVYWLDASGVDQRWLDADLWKFLQSLPEANEEYRIQATGLSGQ